MPTDVIIICPTALQREAWHALLSGQPDILVSGAVGDASGVAVLLRPSTAESDTSSRPVAVLIDVTLAQLDLARQIKAIDPDLGFLFLIQSYDLAEIIPLVQSGAAGFVSRDESVGNLARAIVAVGRGEIVLPPAIAAQALATLARGKPASPSLSEALSEREIEVVRLLGQGLTNKDIAQTLVLSVRTVEAHLRNVYSKLGVRTRTEAALWAVRHGYGQENR